MIISAERIWNRLHELGSIGRNEDGSMTRLTYSEADKQAQELLKSYMEMTDAEVYEDAVGNLIAKLPGTDPDLSPIICGSHFDSVRQGGIFDGCLGVIGGIEVLQTLKEQHQTLHRTLMVYGFKDEEENRFPFGMVGSKAVCGLVKPEQLEVCDKDGIRMADAIKNFGCNIEKLEYCKIDKPYHFVELHIEQGKVLEDQHCPVGIVSSIASMKKYSLFIQGESGHAGGLPMRLRHDPMMAACEFMLSCERNVKEVDHAVATFGTLSIQPSSFNIVPESVEFTLDLRAANDQDIANLEEKLQQTMQAIDKSRGVNTTWKLHQQMASCPCDMSSIQRLERICEEERISYDILMSGAGHDAMNFKNLCPVTMLFVQSQHGYSHRKEEFSSKEDCAAGVEVLYRFICQLGNSK